MRHTGICFSPTRTGYTFLGWFSDDRKHITNETVVRLQGTTQYVEWTEITSDKVEIIFVSKGIKKNVKGFGKGYRSTKFRAIKVEVHEQEGVGAAVKFEEVNNAVDFTNAVKGQVQRKGIVEKIEYALKESFSLALHPAFLLLFMLFAFKLNEIRVKSSSVPRWFNEILSN